MKLRNKYYQYLKNIINECSRVNLVTLASSSSFYLILTFIPTMLLLTRIVGFFLPEDGESTRIITKYLGLIIPTNLQGAIEIIGKILSKALYAKGSYTIFNLVILAGSSMGFINSIWRNLSIITHDNSYNSLKKYLKGFVFLAIGITFFLCVFFLPTLLSFIFTMLKIPFILNILNYFSLSELYQSVLEYLNSAEYISYVLTVLFATLFYKFILFDKVDTKRAAIGAFLFTSSLSLVRVTFYLYADMVTSGLLSSYGASYIIVLMYIWVFLIMVLFYSSIIISLELMKFKKTS